MILKIKDIHTYYGESYVLQGISLNVEKGTIVGILGRNGMGKTTLIRSIIGFTPPRRGEIFFKDVDITHMPVGAVFDETNTVGSFSLFVLELERRSALEMIERS